MALCFRFVCFLFAHIPHHRPPPSLQDSLDFHFERKAKRYRAPSLTPKTPRHHHRHRRREGLPEKKNKEDNEHVCPIRGRVSLPVALTSTNANANTNTPSSTPPPHLFLAGHPRTAPGPTPSLLRPLPNGRKSPPPLPLPFLVSHTEKKAVQNPRPMTKHQKRGRTSATNGGGYQHREKKSVIRALAVRLSNRAFEARKTITGADTKQTGKLPSPPQNSLALTPGFATPSGRRDRFRGPRGGRQHQSNKRAPRPRHH